MWSSKKNTIQVFFVLTEDRTDIEDMSETMQLALQVSGDVPIVVLGFINQENKILDHIYIIGLH